MITEEMLKQFLEGAAKYQDVVVHQAADLIDQVLAFYIFDSVLNIIKFGAIFLLLIVVRRWFKMGLQTSRDELAEYEDEYKKYTDRRKASEYGTNAYDNSARDANHAFEKIQFRKKDISFLESARFYITLAATIAFLCFTVPHIREIGKIMVAPKLFIIEKSQKFIADFLGYIQSQQGAGQ